MAQLTPLGDLIAARQRITGWSLRDLERESHISKTMWLKYKTGPLANMPSTSNLRAIAAVLALPEYVIVEAALATVGLGGHRPSAVPDINAAIDAQPWLDEGDRNGLKALMAEKRRHA